MRFISPIIASKLNEIPFKDELTNLSSFKTFFALAVLFRITLITTPCSVGEDIAPQVLSSKQWIEGESIAPNVHASPKRTDLSLNEQNWMLRPPGGAWIPLPGLLLGFSLGNSIHLSLFVLALLLERMVKMAQVLDLPGHPSIACVSIGNDIVVGFYR